MQARARWMTTPSPNGVASAQVWTDPRYAAVPEARRTELWREFRAVLAELAAPAAAGAAPAAPAIAPAAAPSEVAAGDLGMAPLLDLAEPALAGATAAPALAAAAGSLTALQAEQARLQLEYAKMEARPARSRPARSRPCVTAARTSELIGCCGVAGALRSIRSCGLHMPGLACLFL